VISNGAIGSADDIIDESIIDELSMGISDDIIELSMGISEDIIELSIGISDDIIDESIIDDESCATAGIASRAATAVVARRVRIIVVSLGSTSVGHAARREAWLGERRAVRLANVESAPPFRRWRVRAQKAAGREPRHANPC
jgi:hypothetical protein